MKDNKTGLFTTQTSLIDNNIDPQMKGVDGKRRSIRKNDKKRKKTLRLNSMEVEKKLEKKPEQRNISWNIAMKVNLIRRFIRKVREQSSDRNIATLTK